MVWLAFLLLFSPDARTNTCASLSEKCLSDYGTYDFNFRIVACSGGANQCSGNPTNPHVVNACLKVASFGGGLGLMDGTAFAQRSGSCAKALSLCGKAEATRLQQELEGKSVDLKASCTDWAKNTADQNAIPKNSVSGKNGATKTGTSVPEPKRERRYRYELAYSIFLSDKAECIAKERSRKQKFCWLLYANAEKIEGAKGRMPDDLRSAIEEAEVAKLRMAPVRLVLDFARREECKAELVRLSFLHKGITDFFASYSMDLDLVCQAIIDDELPALWQVTKGPKPKVLHGTRKN